MVSRFSKISSLVEVESGVLDHFTRFLIFLFFYRNQALFPLTTEIAPIKFILLFFTPHRTIQAPNGFGAGGGLFGPLVITFLSHMTA